MTQAEVVLNLGVLAFALLAWQASGLSIPADGLVAVAGGNPADVSLMTVQSAGPGACYGLLMVLAELAASRASGEQGTDHGADYRN
jgi:hypothetical protein